MSSLFGELGKLFKPDSEPLPTQDSWPDEQAPGYYEDNSVDTLGDANAGITAVQWDGPTADYSIPFRGTELHGVPPTTKHYEVIPSPIVPAKNNEDPIPPTITVPELDPIPVRIIETPTPPYVEKYIATDQYTVSNTLPPVRIMPKSDRRFRTRVMCINGTALIGSHNNTSLSQMGFLLPANQFLELDITESVWAVGNNATADTIYVIEEVQREYDENEMSSL